ncbi:MAG TPA: flavodoxin family protein [Geobacteraceae bacterium]|nr:flavodoxin family protein [Geobacteraceae bacterium]
MKIVAIMGSPHGMKGNTGCLLEVVIAGVRQGGGEVELIDLAGKKVEPCVSCEVCHKTGKCHIKDDYEEIKARLLGCDGFILASPNYIASVTAQMKALFDRCTNIIHCVSMEGKYGAVVETSGSGEDDEVIRYMERFINTVGAQSVGGVGSGMAGVRTFPDEEALFAKARELGRELCRSIQQKRHFPGQDAFRNAFKARMKRLVEYRQKDWTSEYEYWQARNH